MKIVGKILCVFFLHVFAFGASLQLHNSQVLANNAVRFDIQANGSDVEIENISKIGEFDVMYQGSSSSMSNINGKITNSISKSFIFYPDKNVTIPSFKVIVDGKIEYTKQAHVSVVSSINKKIPYKITLHVNDKNITLGQMIELKVDVSLSENESIGDLNMQINGIDKFLTQNGTSASKNENGYKIITNSYFIMPLDVGVLDLQADLRVGYVDNNPMRSFFGESYSYKYAKSNKLSLHVNELKGVNFVGEYSIKAFVDKDEQVGKKPINLTLQIQGNGDLSQLKSLKKDILNTLIYDDKPNVKTSVKNGEFFSTWEQKIAYVGSEDFTILPFEFTFYDPKTKKIQTISTQKFDIKVKNNTKKSKIISSIEKHDKAKIESVKNDNYLYLFFAFILGVVCGGAFVYFYKHKKTLHVNMPTQKELFQKVLIYSGKDKRLDEILELLEQNIYKNAKNKINKKEIFKIIDNINHFKKL